MSPETSLADILRRVVTNVVVLDQVDSTHLMAQRLIEQMDDEGLDLAPTIIVANSQSKGVGRRQRKWTPAGRGLHLNWIRSGLDQTTVALLPMFAAASLRETVESFGVQGACIKWPNDILVNGAKIAGILVHARHSDSVWATIGIGVNLAEAPVIDTGLPATAMANHLKKENLDDLLAPIALRFVENLHTAIDTPEKALDQWRSHLVHKIGDNLSIRLASDLIESGRLLEVSKEGFLRIMTTEGERTITGGDIIE